MILQRLLAVYRSPAMTPIRTRLRLHRRAAVARALFDREVCRWRPVGSPILRQTFTAPLVDLGVIDYRFAGVAAARADLGSPKSGVRHPFLEGAEDYHAAHQGFAYWKALITTATERAGLTAPQLVIEVGAGFGNSTLPLLELFPSAHVVATDISPNLLAILRRLARERALHHRLDVVAMDAHRGYFKPGCADLVLGSAILHHLVDPGRCVAHALAALRPGGAAIFFEPFETGNAMFRTICLTIAEEAARRGASGPALDLLAQIAGQLEPQLLRHRYPDWPDWDDKWTFTRSMFENMRREFGAHDLVVYGLADSQALFSNQARYYLKQYKQLEPDALPDWAWAIFARFETEYLPPATLAEMVLEGCVIFIK